jgi:MarR family transcriptional regulator, multiple antibiotic resistance protein MarR
MYATLYAVASSSASEGRAGLFDDLVRCETRLYNAIGSALQQQHGIVTSQFELLRYLRDHPGARVAPMATAFAAGIGAISKGVDRLERLGWAERTPNPDDRRSSLIGLTPSGAELVGAAERTFVEQLDLLLSPALSDEQVESAAAVIGVLRRALEGARIGMPIG